MNTSPKNVIEALIKREIETMREQMKNISIKDYENYPDYARESAVKGATRVYKEHIRLLQDCLEYNSDELKKKDTAYTEHKIKIDEMVKNILRKGKV